MRKPWSYLGVRGRSVPDDVVDFGRADRMGRRPEDRPEHVLSHVDVHSGADLQIA